MMAMTTVKVTTEVRDRLKAQARAAHRTLGEHLAHLADLSDRAARFESLRAAIEATPEDLEDSYREEFAAWDRLAVE
jgi:hypothetical protein